MTKKTCRKIKEKIEKVKKENQELRKSYISYTERQRGIHKMAGTFAQRRKLPIRRHMVIRGNKYENKRKRNMPQKNIIVQEATDFSENKIQLQRDQRRCWRLRRTQETYRDLTAGFEQPGYWFRICRTEEGLDNDIKSCGTKVVTVYMKITQTVLIYESVQHGTFTDIVSLSYM